jgi:hypothetical protein
MVVEGIVEDIVEDIVEGIVEDIVEEEFYYSYKHYIVLDLEQLNFVFEDDVYYYNKMNYLLFEYKNKI